MYFVNSFIIEKYIIERSLQRQTTVLSDLLLVYQNQLYIHNSDNVCRFVCDFKYMGLCFGQCKP